MEKIYPIGIENFEKIVESNWRYVDKTGYMYELIQHYNYAFLNRPPHFGKSLLISTIRSFFEGRKDLFEGLEAGRLEKDWAQHPVLHFDMSTAKHYDSEQLENDLECKLSRYEEVYGRSQSATLIGQRLESLIKRASKQTGQKAVVLIDECDAPLLNWLNDAKALKANWQVMSQFYSPLKACDPYLCFVFITGITRFSQPSIFSGFNNLSNVSMTPDLAGICGITQEELETQFSDDVDDLAARLGLSREATLLKLKEHYNGYHFTENSPDIYNPFSLINAFSNGAINNYWFSTGIPTYLIDQMHRFGFTPQSLDEFETISEDFDAPIERIMSITPLLYQHGYLTIKDYDPELYLYTLGVPNSEVRTGLMNNMVL